MSFILTTDFNYFKSFSLTIYSIYRYFLPKNKLVLFLLPQTFFRFFNPQTCCTSWQNIVSLSCKINIICTWKSDKSIETTL